MVTISLQRLLLQLSGLPRRHRTLLVGIDGCGGAGKSTLAMRLAALDPNISVVHTDDFYLPSAQRPAADTEGIGESFDWKRLRDHVLAPLNQETPARYQRYDWDRDALAEWHDVPAGGIVIVEGIYTTRKELWGQYDFGIWVDSPSSIRLSRGIARDGESVRHLWETEWMPAEDRYLAIQRPDLQADMVIDGSGGSASIQEGLIAVARAPRCWVDG